MATTIGILHSGTAGNPNHAAHIQALMNGITLAANRQSFTLAYGGPLYSNDDPQQLRHNAGNLTGSDVLVAAGGSASAQAANRAVTNDGTPQRSCTLP